MVWANDSSNIRIAPLLNRFESLNRDVMSQLHKTGLVLLGLKAPDPGLQKGPVDSKAPPPELFQVTVVVLKPWVNG